MALSHELAAALVPELIANDLTVSVAESLTGGLVMAALTQVPGASACVRGGIVAYATDLKARLLEVDGKLLARAGPVDPEVAAQMAQGVARLCGADLGLATTGVAGPAELNGVPVGTVYVAAHNQRTGRTTVRALELPGDRDKIRVNSVTEVLGLARVVVKDHSLERE